MLGKFVSQKAQFQFLHFQPAPTKCCLPDAKWKQGTRLPSLVAMETTMFLRKSILEIRKKMRNASGLLKMSIMLVALPN
jgi:hypothetical protein